MFPFEKLKTSSERSLRMFRALEHLFIDSLALAQISGIKFCHEVFHSSFTIEIKVALSLVSRNCCCDWICESSGKESASWMSTFLIPCLFSSLRICQRV